MEQTLVILKPDALQRGFVGEIIQRFERKGLKIVAMKMQLLKTDVLSEHYSHHKEKPFFKELVKFMGSAPAVLMVLEGKEAVDVARKMAGETSGRKASPGTIRGDCSMSMQTNLIHVSDSVKTASEEIRRFFKKEEIHSYEKSGSDWLYSSDERK